MGARTGEDWLLLQLADSAFPAGGFAHSGGLEASVQAGEVTGSAELERFLREALWQAGYGALVLASAAHAEPERLGALDEACDVFLSNHVANRASRVQGRAFLSTCVRSFGTTGGATDEFVGHAAGETVGAGGGVAAVADKVRTLALLGHHAPLFGAVLRALGVARVPMQRLYLHATLRGLVSAAIRLGTIGPYQGQRLQFKLAPALEAVLRRCGALEECDLAQTSPLLDLFQATHDRLYSRLFQS